MLYVFDAESRKGIADDQSASCSSSNLSGGTRPHRLPKCRRPSMMGRSVDLINFPVGTIISDCVDPQPEKPEDTSTTTIPPRSAQHPFGVDSRKESALASTKSSTPPDTGKHIVPG